MAIRSCENSTLISLFRGALIAGDSLEGTKHQA